MWKAADSRGKRVGATLHWNFFEQNYNTSIKPTYCVGKPITKEGICTPCTSSGQLNWQNLNYLSWYMSLDSMIIKYWFKLYDCNWLLMIARKRNKLLSSWIIWDLDQYVWSVIFCDCLLSSSSQANMHKRNFHN